MINQFDPAQKYTFNFPTRIRFGAGVIKELAPYLKETGLSKPLLVTDPVIRELDFFKSTVNTLQAEGLAVSVFSDMHKNPIKSDVLAGGDAFDQNGCDCIVGIGGGAALDVARAIVLRINHRRDLFDYDDLIGGDVYVTNEVPHFVTVPTTSGTGSEVGRSAIISEDESHKKRILFSPKLLAKIVFADPELTMGLPAFVTAATGMDALTHNMEAYIAKNWHPICDGIALEGMAMIAKNIEKATKNPDITSRAYMLLGSMMGAIAFQKGLGVVHSLSHPLSTLLDTHHGLGNAVNLPYGMKFNYTGCEEKFDNMARVLGAKSGAELPEFLFELNDKVGIPRKLGDIGVKEEHLETLADLAIADFAHPNNPKPCTREDFLTLYKEAL
ncbi:MAG: iron-containing alcohol dehydrogenase [Flavobacteriales bacterium]|nr:iron-containing alcohol dehydrogenase [Flavobacteriales bacterium]